MIKWLDKQQANNKYVLEITFIDGGKGYLKNDSLEKINHYQNLMNNSKDVERTEIIQTPLSKCA